MVISTNVEPYGKMIDTSLSTWDSVEVEGVETIFYCGEPVKENTDKIIYFPIEESLFTMGEKTILAYEWALKNKEFDYIARVNSSCYVNKKELIKHIQTLPNDNVFAGLRVDDKEQWIWGGGQFLISKDIIQKFVDNKRLLSKTEMEDKGFSYLANKLAIPYSIGKAASIERTNNGWICMCYNGQRQSFNFNHFNEIGTIDQYFYRVKQDGKRELDEFIMNELFKNL